MSFCEKAAASPCHSLGLASLMAGELFNLLMQQPEKTPTHLTSTSPPTCMRKEPSGCFREYRYCSSFSLRSGGREAGDGNGQCSVSRREPFCASSLRALCVPVNDVVGLLGANDAQRIDCCIRGCKVWVLAGAPSEATVWALTQLQEVTHTRYTAKGKSKVKQH